MKSIKLWAAMDDDGCCALFTLKPRWDAREGTFDHPTCERIDLDDSPHCLYGGQRRRYELVGYDSPDQFERRDDA